MSRYSVCNRSIRITDTDEKLGAQYLEKFAGVPERDEAFARRERSETS